MQTNYKEKIALILIILAVCAIIGISGYYAGKNNVETSIINSQIKQSEKVVKTYKKEFDSLQKKYSILEAKKQEVKTIYVAGKETIKYIDSSRIKGYTDSLCKDDVITLKNHLNVSDSLISVQDQQLINYSKSNNLLRGIISEKDYQIELYKNQKPKTKPFGIGIVAGYGTDLKNGFKPFVGLGVGYSFVRL